jgi:uncharacterized protein (TIGR03437 family)
VGAVRTSAVLSVSGLWLFAQGTPAPPAIDPGGVVNAASRLPASLAGGAIARRARFILSGVRLGPDPGLTASQSDPPASLGGVSVAIAQGENRVSADLFFAGPERIEGWIPSSAPLGPVSITVTYDGRTSLPYEMSLVASSLGFFSADEPPVAVPGETVVLTGTGAGGAPLRIFVGGIPVTGKIDVRADPCCKGVDRIGFHVPADAPAGCFVPVQALAVEGRPSNTVSLAVHRPGRPCRDRVDWFRHSAGRASRTGFFAMARISMAPDRDFDYGFASFGEEQAGHRALPPLPPADSCTLIAGSLNVRQIVTRARNSSPPAAVPSREAVSPRFDAGPAISIRGHDGSMPLPREPRQPLYYDGVLGGFPPYTRKPPAPLFLAPGAYSVAAPGGADIGPFSVKLRVPRPILWTNRDDLAEIDRSRGVTLTWRPSQNNSAVLVAAIGDDLFTGDAAACICVAAARNRRFTIPARALANLPVPREEDREFSYLLLAEIPADPPVRIRARGLDEAFAAYVSVSIRSVRYK